MFFGFRGVLGEIGRGNGKRKTGRSVGLGEPARRLKSADDKISILARQRFLSPKIDKQKAPFSGLDCVRGLSEILFKAC